MRFVIPLLIFLQGCVVPAVTPTPAASPISTVTVPATCTYRTAADGEPLPDPACTPGAYNPDVTQATIGSTICVTGWTATVRPPESYTGPLKIKLMAAYHTTTPSSRTELDHFVPLELGGSPTSVANLWPEPNDPSGLAPSPTGVNNRKDKLETRAKEFICSGRLTLDDARRRIQTDWDQFANELGI